MTEDCKSPRFSLRIPTKSILVSKQQSQSVVEDDLSKEVSETYDQLVKALKKIKDVDPEKYKDLNIRDLIIKNSSEFILVYASRKKKKMQQQEQDLLLWKNVMKMK